ncbi:MULTISPECIES: Rrf2 family transcriptional regulator [unclassified Sphingomonas]|uniref:RrF2 family transcriptional regulator n=1 Tax=unclassified Sphingomonas TaxID=196159 RepID=UPI000BDA37EB|nr:MAG: transcriptional regulator [Sphingomonas sp. 12-62-6]OYX38319.1 MAG: transcriptional regulator [Sphingomonas sp. 32-62-10]OYY63955.1 MAG: transcriptional regulator [Sphingomonas sp. 28-62-11]
MLTQRSRYALRAMLFLAEAPKGSAPIPMTRIAAEANVPRKFLELILADLREAGLLHSHRGKMGGYCLSRPTHLISLGEIIRVIEGPLALIPCVSRTAYRKCADCKSEADCAIRHAMMRVRDETARILDGTSLADANAQDLAAA